ncbi:MAG: hypothetical protein ACXIUV_03975 [Alkalilacustris sp.]
MTLMPRRIGALVVARQNTPPGISPAARRAAPPAICGPVDIGAGGVLVGARVVRRAAPVGASAVVTKSVPRLAIVAGVPARGTGRRGPAGLPDSGA